MKFKINRYLTDDIENRDHPSDFERTDEYSIFILRLPYIKKDTVDTVSYAFLIKDNEVYGYSRDRKEFYRLGTFQDLHTFLDTRVDKILAKISKLNMQIAKMEDKLYEGDIDKSFVNRWLYYKKELALIERLMEHSLIAFERFIKYYKNKLDELAFKDLLEHMVRAFRLSKNANEKLDYLYSFYRAKMDEKMNNIMFILTIISAVFLPLTLVTGFFGMNTGGLPLTEDANGTLKVTLLFLAFEVPFVALIWKIMKRK
ncbi:magnesium transporter CorA family protein [Nitrosophilus alvini]|uniref:magnesium transporter CorA family protein n=1 Tax=Nitrosophilus alvini TaxID=2714855 RepID=UPI00190DC14A|nr:CorA family divalent cation transporter [Nitrosophilus alvini]